MCLIDQELAVGKKLVVMWSCRLVDFFYLCNYEKNITIYI